MPTLNEGKLLSDVVLFEEAAYKYSRNNETLITGQNLLMGAVVSKITLGAATAAAKSGGNTGNGTLVMDATTPVQPNAITGVYTVRAITAGTNTATFRVTDPLGRILGDVTFNGAGASATFTNHVKFAVTDGATDFIVGDGFDITIAAGSGKITALAPTATDGSQVAFGVLLTDVNATAADQACPVLRREAVVKDSGLVWPGGITNPQRATAIAQLELVGIVIRPAY
jgi:hypothetical protein